MSTPRTLNHTWPAAARDFLRGGGQDVQEATVTKHRLVIHLYQLKASIGPGREESCRIEVAKYSDAKISP